MRNGGGGTSREIEIAADGHSGIEDSRRRWPEVGLKQWVLGLSEVSRPVCLA